MNRYGFILGSCFSGVKDDKNNWVYRVGYTWSTVVAAAGTRVAYDHRAYLWDDKVEIPGPTKHELKLKVNGSPLHPFLIFFFQFISSITLLVLSFSCFSTFLSKVEILEWNITSLQQTRVK